MTADLHRELQLPYIVVGKRACDVVERREADLSARVKQRIVLGVRIRAADEVVEGERIEERRTIFLRVRRLIGEQPKNLPRPRASVAVFLRGQRHIDNDNGKVISTRSAGQRESLHPYLQSRGSDVSAVNPIAAPDPAPLRSQTSAAS